MTTDITNLDDVIDVRDVIERVEELRQERQERNGEEWESGGSDNLWAAENPELDTELSTLAALLSGLRGYGGDHQWEGDWYPVTLIHEGYFTEYAQELAEEIGAINADATWPNNCIDWERAARELKVDYSEVDYDGMTYYYR